MVTDYIIIFALLYLFYRGWSRGILRMLIGPLSFVTCCIAGFFYYQKTQNIATSLLICIISPFILTICASLTLKLWSSTVSNKAFPSPLSRMLGSLFSILWGGSYLILLLIMIEMIPARFGWLERIQNNIAVSKSYSLFNNLIKDQIPAASIDLKKITHMIHDPSVIEEFESTKEFQDFAKDERLKAIFSDEEISEQIRNKNYSQLLSNPKIQAIFSDQELFEKLLALNKRIMEGHLEGDVSQENTENPEESIPLQPIQK